MDRKISIMLLVVGAAFVTAGCAGLGKAMRSVTYPPDFTYIPRDKVHSTMWALAEEVRELDRALRDPAGVEPGKQSKVLVILARMRDATRKLEGQGGHSNHPLLDRHLPRFAEDVSAARAAAAATPPRYTLAAVVSGACIYCHQAAVASPPPPG